jgi:hypothetical protein
MVAAHSEDGERTARDFDGGRGRCVPAREEDARRRCLECRWSAWRFHPLAPRVRHGRRGGGCAGEMRCEERGRGSLRTCPLSPPTRARTKCSRMSSTPPLLSPTFSAGLDGIFTVPPIAHPRRPVRAPRSFASGVLYPSRRPHRLRRRRWPPVPASFATAAAGLRVYSLHLDPARRAGLGLVRSP